MTILPAPSPNAGATPTPSIAADRLSKVWQDERDDCIIFHVVALTNGRLIATGWCGTLSFDRVDPFAWTSTSGLDWYRLISGPTGTYFEGVAEDVEPGHLLMAVNGAEGPQIWRGDPTSAMAVSALPVRGNSTVKDVAWAGDRYLAVGYVYIANDTRAVAWTGDADGTVWTEIDAPPEASAFEAVEPGISTGSFTVAGGNYQRGSIYWELDASGTWSSQQEGISDLIDSRTAFGGETVWQRQNGAWSSRKVETQERVDVTSGARLSDGWVVAGWPPGEASHPFMVFVAGDHSDWKELPRLRGDDPGILDFTVFRNLLIGVGNGAYAGPAAVRSY